MERPGTPTTRTLPHELSLTQLYLLNVPVDESTPNPAPLPPLPGRWFPPPPPPP
jgi:hypothetical protein